MERGIKIISVGGSIIIPQEKKDLFLIRFKKMLKRNYHTGHFVLVCGGGSIARSYQSILQKENKNYKEQSKAGIRATRMNAEFLMQLFGKEANDFLPRSMKEVKNALRKNKLVICGSLRYADNETSDSTAAKLADYLDAEFVNITNVAGLYTADPKKDPKARLVPHQTWEAFEKRARAIHYHPGQHFVLDQKAAQRIKKKKIRTSIVGKDIGNIEKALQGKPFKGTLIEG